MNAAGLDQFAIVRPTAYFPYPFRKWIDLQSTPTADGLEIAAALDSYLYWHTSIDVDAANKWLRKMIMIR